MSMKQLPNLVTIFNLISGCLSILFLFSGKPELAAWMIGVAALLDFLDGMLARLLKASSELGKMLDSLADIVSFGVAPGFIMFELIRSSGNFPEILAYIALLVPALSAVRLAIFSLDNRQQYHFIGVPTPLNALMIASIPLILAQYRDDALLSGIFSSTWVLVCITAISSILLVAPLRIMALKFKTYRWRDNRLKFIVLLISVILMGGLGYLALPLIYIVFLLSSLFIKKV